MQRFAAGGTCLAHKTWLSLANAPGDSPRAQKRGLLALSPPHGAPTYAGAQLSLQYRNQRSHTATR